MKYEVDGGIDGLQVHDTALLPLSTGKYLHVAEVLLPDFGVHHLHVHTKPQTDRCAYLHGASCWNRSSTIWYVVALTCGNCEQFELVGGQYVVSILV